MQISTVGGIEKHERVKIPSDFYVLNMSATLSEHYL